MIEPISQESCIVVEDLALRATNKCGFRLPKSQRAKEPKSKRAKVQDEPLPLFI